MPPTTVPASVVPLATALARSAPLTGMASPASRVLGPPGPWIERTAQAEGGSGRPGPLSRPIAGQPGHLPGPWSESATRRQGNGPVLPLSMAPTIGGLARSLAGTELPEETPQHHQELVWASQPMAVGGPRLYASVSGALARDGQRAPAGGPERSATVSGPLGLATGAGQSSAPGAGPAALFTAPQATPRPPELHRSPALSTRQSSTGSPNHISPVLTARSGQSGQSSGALSMAQSDDSDLPGASTAPLAAETIEWIIEQIEERVLEELDRRGLRHNPGVF